MKNPIYSSQPSPMMKQTYGFAQTNAIMDTFRERGWELAEAKFGKARAPHRDGFQKHIVRLEHPKFERIEGLSDSNATRPQIVLLNSHDGTTALRMFVGMIRIACLNGMIAGTSITDFRLIHSKASIGNLHNGIDTMLENLPVMFDQVRTLQQAQPSREAIKAYIREMYDARVKPIGRVTDVNYSLPILRGEDDSLDGFTVMNRVQEMVMRGGIEYRYERDIRDENDKVVSTEVKNAVSRKLGGLSGLGLNRMAYDKAMTILAA